jgi:hypothetical protein
MAGSQVSDTVLESHAAAARGEGKQERWKVASTSEWSTSTPSAGEAPVKPHSRPAKEPASAGEPDKGSSKKPEKKSLQEKLPGSL